MQVADLAQCRSKQLVFDCRYGWVYDEWQEPATIAHLGGRGMFSMVPLTAAAFGKTVDLANKAADVVADILQDRHMLQANLRNLSFKANKTFKTSKGKNVSQEVFKDSSQAPQDKASDFNHALRNFDGKVTFKYELMDNYIGIVRPIL